MRVQIAEYDEARNRTILGEATLEVVVENGELVVRPCILHPNGPTLLERLSETPKAGGK